jgi:hypothetical protein
MTKKTQQNIWIETQRWNGMNENSPNTGDTWYYVMFKPSKSSETVCLAQYSKSKQRAINFLVKLKKSINSL